ncbi:MAG TPA: o-succinylbenzoate synthase [Thermoanaerobaculia bacterium]|jgi:O-succinylbenzoate synthase
MPPDPEVRPGEALAVESVEVRRLRLPLHEPFETSFGSVATRLIVLVELKAGDESGWGEIVAGEEPLYSYETVETAAHVLREYFAPALLEGPLGSVEELASRLSVFRGHPMARAGLELAFADLAARARGESLSRFLGGTRDRVPVGVSLGIQPNLPALLERVDRYVGLGYRRIKLKIKPGWDLEIVAEVRRRHPEIQLSVDANAAYTLGDRKRLKALDAFGLLMIEQPLDPDDLVDHAALQKELATPICLDESITGLRAARQALDLGSCRIVNMKVGRVGGYTQALAIQRLCVERKVPLWCGGMLESGIGRAHNIALASLPGFDLPGDISASRRYFARDVIVPEVVLNRDGTVDVPRGPGIGFEVDRDFVASRTEGLEKLTKRGRSGS